MNNWYRLNLPDQKLTKLGLHLTKYPQNKPPLNYTCILNPAAVLSPNIIDVFKTLNVNPWFVIFFSNRGDAAQSWNQNFVHTDLTGIGNDQWQRITGGISFEANPTTVSYFKWFDTTDYPEIYPVHKQKYWTEEYNILQGGHYGERGLMGTLPGIKEIDKVCLNSPTLVRTDTPHGVTYETLNGIRCSVSIRFKESIEPWESFSNRFLPIIEK